ncbi:hypothetical protein OOU_Y34scaffold00597g13 [Pyricularia oryzae Y34]|uniref:Uncharacterized protein n=2 Tax=Pyricularia oryzae TaxID=318829 RepID=A0AA97PJY4_PYRO3|nr:hypothetical protein OOU_Y34scaffold00597g13 [Pyricularia oryzae Y34]
MADMQASADPPSRICAQSGFYSKRRPKIAHPLSTPQPAHIDVFSPLSVHLLKITQPLREFVHRSKSGKLLGAQQEKVTVHDGLTSSFRKDVHSPKAQFSSVFLGPHVGFAEVLTNRQVDSTEKQLRYHTSIQARETNKNACDMDESGKRTGQGIRKAREERQIVKVYGQAKNRSAANLVGKSAECEA